MSKYKAKIVPVNGFMGTYWESYIEKDGKKYNLVGHYIFSLAQNAYEQRKKQAAYLNKEAASEQ